MCPACITAIAFTVAGTTSAGGFAALVARKVRGRTSEKAAVRGGAAPHDPGVVAAVKRGRAWNRKEAEHETEPIRVPR